MAPFRSKTGGEKVAAIFEIVMKIVPWIVAVVAFYVSAQVSPLAAKIQTCEAEIQRHFGDIDKHPSEKFIEYQFKVLGEKIDALSDTLKVRR